MRDECCTKRCDYNVRAYIIVTRYLIKLFLNCVTRMHINSLSKNCTFMYQKVPYINHSITLKF